MFSHFSPSRWRRISTAVVLSTIGACTYASTRRPIRLEEPREPDAANLKRAEEVKKAKLRHEVTKAAKEFCTFVDKSPSVYHAVDTVKKHLLEWGFTEITEKESWTSNVSPGGRYFLTRSGSSGSSLIAFAVGSLWEPGNPFAMVATHLDSPCLKLKPLSDRSAYGYRQVGVETYGGGRAFVRTSPTTIESFIVQIDEPILRVPSVAVHLESQNPFKFHTESQLIPLAGQISAETPKEKHDHGEEDGPKQFNGPFGYEMSPAAGRHNKLLVERLAEKLNVHPSNILDFDLSLYDVQKAAIGGLNDEFIFSARIDNLMMSYCALQGFTKSLQGAHTLDDETSIRMLVMFDHEEIGSVGPIGAQSSFLPSTLQRLSALKPASPNPEFTGEENREKDYTTAYEQAISRSFLISADMAHGQHPHYSSYHESYHRPQLNRGIIFASTSRRYLSKNTPGTVMLLELICRLPEGQEPPKTQFWVAPNGGDCGSTVGPHLESRLGARVIDLGNAALSMHSIREMAGATDVENGIRFLQAYYEAYSYFEGWVDTK